MSYQVLARKWRPHSFQEMVGQEHIVRALTHALDQNRLHHAYLFTGTRGVGKTTLARILAKCLNCERGISSTPCGQCSSCLEIDAGRFLDLIEVDAASRTKVEDTRELLENVQYAPTKGRYKIYLIDEVHMLSGHSFNALLKTLEEPPEHVKFLLATTDPQRLPVTVLSRCLQLHLKNLPAAQITSQLQYILTQEKITFEMPALQQLGRAANGSMRDSLSLLDQAIVYGNGQVIAADVNAMLGSTEPSLLRQLLQTLIDNDANGLVNSIMQMATAGIDFNQALEEFITLLHQIALLQAVPTLVTDNWENSEEIHTLAKKLSKEEVQLYYQIGIVGRRDLPLAPTPRSGFEMVMLRMLAFQLQNATTHITSTPKINTQKTITPVNETVTKSAQAAVTPATQPSITNSNLTNTVTANVTNDWAQLLSQLNLRGASAALAAHCVLTKLTENEVRLSLDSSQAPLLNKTSEQILAQALQAYLQKPIRLFIEVNKNNAETPAAIAKRQRDAAQAVAIESIANDGKVQAIINTFNAKIVQDSIAVVSEKDST